MSRSLLGVLDGTVIKQGLVQHSNTAEAALLRFHFNIHKVKRGEKYRMKSRCTVRI